MKITEQDARHAKVCSRMKPWFRKHGLDWQKFCSEGIELNEALAVGDQHARIMRAADQAKKRLEKEASE